jgi:hypothetical protein
MSITRDQEKQKALLQLLKSDSFKKLDSILIYATHKRTCDLLASVLTVSSFFRLALAKRDKLAIIPRREDGPTTPHYPEALHIKPSALSDMHDSLQYGH